MRDRPRQHRVPGLSAHGSDEPGPSAEGVYALLRTSLLAGLAIAALVFPLAAMAGLSAKAGFDSIDTLSVEVTETDPPLTSYVYAADGETLVSLFYDEFRRHVALDEVAPVMQQAMVSAEDSRFYTHNGVDYRGIVRAMVANNSSGGVEQGASTITMQYVRGALQLNAETIDEVIAATEQTATRKLTEARLAMAVEEQLTKDQILERYLNQAYFGHNAYGIFAAAQVYFSKHPSELNLQESATLAGLVQAPSAYDPITSDQTQALGRRNWVLDRMVDIDYLSRGDASEVRGLPIELQVSDPPNSCIGIQGTPTEFGFFCDYFRRWWREQDAFGATPAERERELRQGGYTIITTLDPDIQKMANKHVNDAQSEDSRLAHGAVVMEPGTGRIKAMGLNRTFSYDQKHNGPHSNPSFDRKGNYPNTVNPVLGGGAEGGYQAGSTFKVFTMLAALDAGYPLDYNISSPNRVATSFVSATTACGGRWCPKNGSAAMAGNRDMWSGFGMSVNTYFAQLIDRVGADKTVEMAERMGLQWRSEGDAYYASEERRSGWGPFTLGVSDVQPIEMTNVFNTLAAEGLYCEPIPALRIIDPEGQELDAATPRCHQELDEDVARAATDAARCVTETQRKGAQCGPWGTSKIVGALAGRPVAGKSGTTDGDRASWFLGYTPQLTVGAFMADPDYIFNPVGKSNTTKSKETAGKIFRDALKGVEEVKFKPPSRDIMYGD
ncbi:transglycosylase domain-containing protein [Glycomyces algeriensis]|uniref:transglycosylase domain-containing protein n=1 Tax=Glycomyces algeriensis TaxID=256037 RepID=UPI0022D769FD|nr:transglycosylase domain-containing protein [Glycomyces algeriensis]MDA1365998.1 transglycosylase domain-containing protein [Glycomyces algeriensis]MDR7349235.1 membrane peptidoglycan carboxypeptidase [Glycomyces algeriensis]